MGTHIEDQTAVNELSVLAVDRDDQRIIDEWQDELDAHVQNLSLGEKPAVSPLVEVAGTLVTAHEVERAQAAGHEIEGPYKGNAAH